MPTTQASQAAQSPRVGFIVPYAGEWPNWSQLFFESCRPNPIVDVILLCQQVPPFALPGNVRVVQISEAEIHDRLEKATGLKLGTISPRKICDFRPYYGLAFADILKDYEFWGYCDVDMMFGALGKLLTDEVFQSMDVLSAHNEMFVGHFTILRNTEKINRLGFEIEKWQERCQAPIGWHLDEQEFTYVADKNPTIRWIKSKDLASELNSNFARFGITFEFFGEVAYLKPPDNPVVKWENGGVYFEGSGGKVSEVLYVHFMGTKRWWHWLFFNKKSVLQKTHYFSRIGYNGVRHPAQLQRFPRREFYHLQSGLNRFKITVAAWLRRLLPVKTFVALRRKVLRI
ncbi:MAG TPA: DUF6625 family protein [Phycisphaerae bacterium]|nr:DUF6625 family protein [Phycisphaerae bacterium]